MIVLLSQFLSALSIEEWFSACAALLRDTSSDTATLEKMSIIIIITEIIKSQVKFHLYIISVANLHTPPVLNLHVHIHK